MKNKLIGEQRSGIPKPDEFTGEYPRSFQALAMVGIYDQIGDGVFDAHWAIVRMIHNGSEYRPYIDAGANDHGVEYVAKFWYRLGKVDPMTIDHKCNEAFEKTCHNCAWRACQFDMFPCNECSMYDKSFGMKWEDDLK